MYKEISKFEAGYGDGIVGVSISISINRELTQEEKHDISMTSSSIVYTLHRNTRLIEGVGERSKEKTDLMACFPAFIYAEEIPNGYSKEMVNPWFMVTTYKGRIVIGWRKRVISIDWTGSIIDEDADELFPDEEVTKDEKCIHAWGYAKAKEYITKLLE